MKSNKVNIKTLINLIFFVYFIFSQIISDGGGAWLNIQFYKKIKKLKKIKQKYY